MPKAVNFSKGELIDFKTGQQNIGPVVAGIVEGEIVPDVYSVPELIEAVKLQAPPDETEIGPFGIAMAVLQDQWDMNCLLA
jgi:hypothetical protein